jgi:hypothetical protein
VNRRAGILASVAVILPLPVAAAVPATAAPDAAALAGREESVLDEALVLGTQLWKLRKKTIEVEDRFNALYNQLNKDQDFDVHCHVETPPDRIIKERVCRVAFLENAQEVEVKGLLDGHSAPPADMVAQARQADFEENFLKVINSDPRLRKLVREREALEKKYGEELKRRVANRSWFRFER